jgi:hypothetical protein
MSPYSLCCKLSVRPRIAYLDPPMDSGPFNVHFEFHSKIQKKVDNKFECENNIKQTLIVHRVIQFKAPFCDLCRGQFVSDMFSKCVSHVVSFNDVRHRFDVLNCNFEI